MVAEPNPVFHRSLGICDEIELEIVQGGINLYNYDGVQSFLAILGKEDSLALRDFLVMHIKE